MKSDGNSAFFALITTSSVNQHSNNDERQIGLRRHSWGRSPAHPFLFLEPVSHFVLDSFEVGKCRTNFRAGSASKLLVAVSALRGRAMPTGNALHIIGRNCGSIEYVLSLSSSRGHTVDES
jgi:hypothetical protein